MSTIYKIGPVDENVARTIEPVLEKRLDRLGYRDADIYAGRDHDGEPVIFIEVKYRFSSKPIDTEATFGLVGDIRRALLAIGETRFPHVRHQFDERQKVSGFRCADSAMT